MSGLVYYALDATRQSQYLKIGFTTGLRERVAALKGISASGQVPLILAVEEGTTELERHRHLEYADLRSHGEWFIYEGALVKFVATLDNPHAYLLDRPHLWRYAGGWGPLGVGASSQTPPIGREPPSQRGDSDERDEHLVEQLPPVDF